MKNKYKTYDKILKRIIQDAKIKLDKNQVTEKSKNPKILWEYINKKLGNKVTPNITIKEIKDSNNKLITDTSEIAE